MGIIKRTLGQRSRWASINGGGASRAGDMSTQSQLSHGAARAPREKPSKVTKQRLSQILQQEVQECGRAARQMCQQSGSREVSQGSFIKVVWTSNKGCVHSHRPCTNTCNQYFENWRKSMVRQSKLVKVHYISVCFAPDMHVHGVILLGVALLEGIL